MPFLLTALIKTVGLHLISAHLERKATGAANTLETLVCGLGVRFFAGLLVGLYFTSPPVKTALIALFHAVVGTVI